MKKIVTEEALAARRAEREAQEEREGREEADKRVGAEAKQVNTNLLENTLAART